MPFQLILNPIRDWNINFNDDEVTGILFQLILNPIRDWNRAGGWGFPFPPRGSN